VTLSLLFHEVVMQQLLDVAQTALLQVLQVLMQQVLLQNEERQPQHLPYGYDHQFPFLELMRDLLRDR
jgi:hypothetical protein